VDAVDGEGNGQFNVAGSQKVAVHRMDDSRRRGRALGSNERLSKHLPAENPAARHPLASSGENVFTRPRARVGEVERSEESGQRVAHAL
jgi:hypothetical protein